ncbi:hypothetical protein V8C42DRAFT_326513 [Trichoderma barbatum]
MGVRRSFRRGYEKTLDFFGLSPRSSPQSTANVSSASLQNSSPSPDKSHPHLLVPIKTKASSSSLCSNMSIHHDPISHSSQHLSDSQYLSPPLKARPSTSPGLAQPFISTALPAITISHTEASPCSPVAEASPSPPVTEGITTVSAPPINLWEYVFDKVNDGTKKWIRDHGLSCTDRSHPEGQIKDLIALLTSKTLSEEKDVPLKIEIGNQKIIFREYIADVVAFLTMAGDAAIAFAPPQASAPWAAAKALLKIPVKHVEQMAALAGTIQWFTRIIRRGQMYESLYNTTTTDEQVVSNLQDALRDMYIAAMELLARSDVLFGSGMAKQTLNAILRPEQASGLVSVLSKKEQQVLLEAQACEASRNTRAGMKFDQRIGDVLTSLDEMSAPLTRTDESVTKLLEEVEKDRRGNLMDFISSEMFGKGHAAIKDARTKNTGDWLINHKSFRDWQAIPSSSTLLYLRGTVGTGKTFLTSRVIEHVKGALKSSTHDEGFAFFYCNRSGPSMQDPLIVLKSFVRQLSYRAYDYDRIQKKVIRRCQLAKEEGRDLSYKDCKELILDSLNLYSRTTIVLDALDESDVTSYNLAEILIDLMEKATKPVKVFISSRPGREYLEAFESQSIITVDSSSQQDDIVKFLDEKLYSTLPFKRRGREIQKLIKDTFKSRNGGMFRWVYLQVQRLLPCTSDDAVKSWAKTIPPDLMGAYDQLWNNIKEQHNEHDMALAERAIQWVLCSFKPLKSDILLEAIRYAFEGDILIRKEVQYEQQILSLCQDLLTIDTERQVWMLPHASVAEYFQYRDLKLGNCDALVARISLEFLMNFEWNDSQSWFDEGVATSFEEYVAHTWSKHVERYDIWLGSMEVADPDAKLVVTLKRFLGLPRESSDDYRKWVDKVSTMRVRKGLKPASMALNVMCSYGFYYVLSDWWEKDYINEEMALQQNREGGNALALAARAGCLPICRYLLSVMDIKNPLADGHVPAMFNAIRAGQKDIASLLVVQGKVDINGALHAGQTPVQFAAERCPNLLQWFVDQGWVDVNREGGTDYGNALIAAVKNLKPQSVEILLKAGADVNAAVESGEYGSALATAILIPHVKSQTKMIQLLVDNGADPNLRLKAGGYGSALEALVVTIGRGFISEDAAHNKDLLDIMLKAGADPAAVLDRGAHGSALAAAACYGLKDLLAMMIDVTGKHRAIECLGQSWHPAYLEFSNGEKFEKWEKKAQETIAHLTDQMGLDKDTLYKIVLWQVNPEEVGRFEMVDYRYSFIYAKN